MSGEPTKLLQILSSNADFKTEPAFLHSLGQKQSLDICQFLAQKLDKALRFSG
jgi:hypothetical protein